jgi:aldehyde:ferredoxin oxidoreductase
MARGYMGKMLFVDLTKGALKDEMLEEKFCRDFIGGYGFGARILFSRQKAGVDPLGPDNILGIITGPLTGTPTLSGTRYTVVGKSPLTGTWGDANSGGDFGPNLKFAGYDGIFFTGISNKPVYLFIEDGHAELRDASNLWGKDTFETEDILKGELGEEVKVVSIGPSGEKLSLIACPVNNKGRAPGRSGLGAVMGSKKLKAVAVLGTMEIPIADMKLAKELRRKYLGELTGELPDLFRDYGTPGITAESGLSGDSPVKNWGGVGVVDFPDIDPIDGDPVIALQSKKYACWRCPFGCGGHMKAGTEYKYEAGAHKPEYETLSAFGSMCLNNNLESIIMTNDICNRYGLDTISAGCTIAFAIECYENGLITKVDTDGIELNWGNHQAIVTMTEKLAKREGFGDILADGVKVASEKLGKGTDQYAMHIQGQEVPMHDPKFGFHMATTYRLDPTPARHCQGSEDCVPINPPMPDFDSKSFSGRGEVHKIGSNLQHICNCIGMCQFMYMCIPAHAITEFMRAVTGWDVTMDELLKTGERISNLRQAFNLREGLNPLQFKVPNRVLGRPPQKEGPLAGVTVDEETLVKDYLTAMDWDIKTAKPSKKKLLDLELDDIARELWP